MISSGFWSSCAAFGSSACLIAQDRTVSHADLARLADDWALRARTLLPPGLDRPLVALEMTASVGTVAAYLGCLRASWPVILLAPGQGDASGSILSTYGPNLVQRADGGSPALSDPRPCPMDADLAMLLSTSGTTGAVKLVRLSGRNIHSNALAIADYLEIGAQDTAITTLPLHYSYGMSVLNSYLAAGARLVLTEESVTADGFWAQARGAGVTSLALVPTQFELLDKIGFQRATLPSLRYVTQAGGRLDPILAQRFAHAARAEGWQLVIMYGQTEASPRIAYVPPEAVLDNVQSIGRAIPGGRLWIENGQGHPIEDAGIAGELVYQGPNVMMGYALSRTDLALPAGPDILRTGDIALRETSGFFRITGRASRFVKLFGLRIGLDEIETQLRRAGHRAYVSGDDRGVVAFVQDASSDTLALVGDDLAARYRLPPSAIRVAPLDAPPLLASGKVDYRTLANRASALLTRPVRQAGLDGEDALRRILRRPDADLTLSFRDLGGDSLAYLEVEMLLGNRPEGLPDGWDRLPLESLLDARPALAGAPQARRRIAVGPELLARVLAILFVIGLHATDLPIGGGVYILTILTGCSLARFQLAQLQAGNVRRMAVSMLLPALAAYYLVLVLLSLRFQIDWQWFLLVANFGAARGDAPQPGWLLPYWFISAYAQAILLIALLFIPRPIRRMASDAPLRIGLALWLVFSGAMLVSGVDDLSYGSQIRHPFGTLQLLFLGWSIALAETPRQKGIVSGAIALSWLWLWGDADPSVALFLTVLPLAILWGPRIPLPGALARGLLRFGTLMLHVYIAHVPALYVARHILDSQAAILAATLLISVAAGWAMKAVLDRFLRWMPGLASRRMRQIA